MNQLARKPYILRDTATLCYYIVMTNNNMRVCHRLKKVGYLLILLTATACTTSAEHHTNPLAAPPTFDVAHATPYTHHKTSSTSAENEQNIAANEPVLGASYSEPDKQLSLSAAEGVNCNIKDRFDRKAVLAYEWGRHTRSRLGLDVDGVGFGSDFEGVKLQYTLRLQSEKPRKMACRYKSEWQGMIGSGYNEMFLRPEHEGAKADFRELRHDVEDRWDMIWD